MAKILVVDDENDARELITRALRRQNFTVASAANGEEAIALLDGSFSAVLTDIVMPRIDGIALIKQIPVLNPGAVCMVITGYADKQRLMEVLSLGVDCLIEKPFSSRELVANLKRLLTERSQGLGMEQIFERRVATLSITGRERQLMVFVLRGLANKEMSRMMEIGEQSIKNALYQLYQKLGIRSRGELFHVIFPI